MQNSISYQRIVAGVLLAPVVYIVVWSYAYIEHSAFHKWIVINTFFAYLWFLVLAAVSHIALKLLGWTRLWQYSTVMLIVASIIGFAFSIYSLAGYDSLFHSQTQVVQNGVITESGYLLYAKDLLINGVISAGAMAVFWLVSFYGTRKTENLEKR